MAKPKRIGGKSKRTFIEMPIEFPVYRDEKLEWYPFTIRTVGETADLMVLLSRSENEDGSAWAKDMLRVLARCMSDRDGVPTHWSLEPTETTEQGEKAYKGPDGKIYALSDTEKLSELRDPKNASSRARWERVMLEDINCEVMIADLLELIKAVLAELGKGRSESSPSSSGTRSTRATGRTSGGSSRSTA